MHDIPTSDQHTSVPPLLRMRAIGKRFGGVVAVENVSLESHAGQVHALCGENGAGKSTLMKILAGAIDDYQGTIELNGQPVRFERPRQAEDRGVRIIHQELNLVPDLSVAANIFLGRERTQTLGFLDERSMVNEAKRLFQRLGTRIDPTTRVVDLRIGDQQMVEIAKSLAFQASILIMDEPTSALSDAEVERLFRVINELRAAGTAIIYISHKMNEVFALADRITILRDGRLVTSTLRTEITPDQVVRAMVGREIATLHLNPTQPDKNPLLSVRNLALDRPAGSSRPRLSSINFELRPGEILGVAGLLGAGRTELLEALFGASPLPPSGEITLHSKPARFQSPSEAIRAGVALVTEDRKSLGLFPDLSVRENISLCRLRNLSQSAGFVSRRMETQAVDAEIQRLGIRTASAEAPVMSLSGGNQQKCVLARWLLTEPSLLLLDEPTRGIDVGAKAEIYMLMKQLAANRIGIIMTSSELPELLTICDRIAVLCEGRLTAILPRASATEEAIMHAATQFLDRAGAA